MLVLVFTMVHIVRELRLVVDYTEDCVGYGEDSLDSSFLTCRGFCDLIHNTPSFWTYISENMTRTEIRRRL